MFKKKQAVVLVIVAVLAGTLLLTGALMAEPSSATVDPWVMAGGGGRVTPASSSMEVTIGQSAVGWVSTDAYGLCAGYWCYEDYAVYLPLVHR